LLEGHDAAKATGRGTRMKTEQRYRGGDRELEEIRRAD